MVIDEKKKELTEESIDLQFYLDRSEAYFKLQTFRVPIQFLVATLQTVLTGPEIVFSLLFLSLGAAIALCAILGSYYLGFIIVGIFYGVISFLIYVFKRKWHNPIR